MQLSYEGNSSDSGLVNAARCSDGRTLLGDSVPNDAEATCIRTNGPSATTDEADQRVTTLMRSSG